MKILHLASFTGNIGDNANHSGFRYWFEKYNDEAEWTELEIREFYWGERKYDESFAELCNQHDLVVIGGGNYFELWPDSHTSTSIDISFGILEKIKTKILFNALGCDDAQGIANLEKFRNFIRHITDSDQFLVCVRNDGSYDTIENLLGEYRTQNIHKVPDGGFFAKVEELDYFELPIITTNIGVNLAGDMLEQRFKGRYLTFCKLFADVVNKQLREDEHKHFVFIPHIYKDLRIISDVLDYIEDKYRRSRVSVASYTTGIDSYEYILGLYKECDLVLGNRFHANVCPIGMGVPTIGLINYPQVEKLYKELNIPELTVKINEPGFETPLNELINVSLSLTESIKAIYKETNSGLTKQMSDFQEVIRQWMS